MQTPQQQAVQRKLLRLSFCMDSVSSKGLSAPSQSRKSSFSPGSNAASAQVHPHAQDWWVEPGESYDISPNFFVFEEIADSSHLGTSFSGSFFCTGASDVLLKDKTKKNSENPGAKILKKSVKSRSWDLNIAENLSKLSVWLAANWGKLKYL